MTTPSHSLRAASIVLGIVIVLAISGCASEPARPPAQTSERPCPLWLDFPANHHSNADSPYLGCVSDVNLRAMVADPADLERGRQLGPADGEIETRAIEAYQQGKVKSFQGSGTTNSSTSSSSSSGSGAQ